MSLPRIVSFTAALLLLGRSAAVAQSAAISVSGNPGPMVITTAVAGANPTGVSNGATTYVVTWNPAGTTHPVARITGQLSANMPTGTTLTITLAAPPRALSAGPVALDTTPRDLVTSIDDKTKSAACAITYQFSATAAAGVVPLTTRTLTLTVISP